MSFLWYKSIQPLYLVQQHSHVSHTSAETSGGHCVRMRVSETYEDYHINLDKPSSHRPSQCRKQINALMFGDLLHAMFSTSNRSALSTYV